MKILNADCTAIYSGRGDTFLDRGVRAIIVKDDGSVSIHNELSNKPLNYMNKANFSETTDQNGFKEWIFESRKESLIITLYNVLSETIFKLDGENDPGLLKDGTEKHLQEWLFNNPHTVKEDFISVKREFETGHGPVDLLMLDGEGNPVAVEVKRAANMSSVDQCRRYRDSLNDEENTQILQEGFSKAVQENSLNSIISEVSFNETRILLAAVHIPPKTLAWAEKHKIETVVIPESWKDLKNRNIEVFDSSISL